MTDAGGKVTLTASYTPWGDLLSIEGEGGFTWGYFGGIMDTATGLLYVGNGQYYDPETGRFLTRNARPDQGNPYVPWRVDPLGSLLSPLALLALIYGRRRKRSKWDTLAILLVFGATMGMSLSACNGNGPTTIRTTEFSATITTMPATTPRDTQMYAVTVTPTLPSSPGPGVLTPSYTCVVTITPTNTPVPTSMETKNWLPNDFIITHYATVLEDDSFFPEESGWIPFYDPKSGDIEYKETPKWRFYLGNNCSGNCGNWRVSFQGSGKLALPESLALSGGMQYVQIDTKHLPPYNPTTGYQQSASYRFTDQPYGACGISFPLIPGATIAVPKSRLSTFPDKDKFVCGDEYYIKEYGNTRFMVTDTGTFDDQRHFDIYVGEQTYSSFYGNFKTGLMSKIAKVQGVP